ncbi:cytochrome c biogenesis protein ResB [Sphaerotilus montanus]|uniref:Cytochrome c biogenesis protein n=1 Tax=Sphaerotilus montanus TaxID=522889 RepID=A0A7Y9R0J4_9BURK|nr:cytochrome c biogenesis protein ResB [Sphaerotilus montanus]NYG32990.1 cytochrome c biogenesis protein [Sphaerotilus montanus]NZD56252.1 cytochrome c biogenesis protein ResB [Sphaerotilus montanus]
MSASPSGSEVQGGSRWKQETVELLSSMRFAIALFTIICIASVIGTVVQQHQPPVNYVNQFGPFWAEVFGRLGLYAVYSTAWFLLILVFLVVSTSLCVARHTPKILADLRNYKENIRESALLAFHLKASGALPLDRAQALARVSEVLANDGWKGKAQVREGGVMVAARQGAANKLGYIAAHSAIVLICIGGLLDGDLIVNAQMALLGKSTYAGGGLIKDVAPEHRLSTANPTFRANLYVPEKAVAGTAVINLTSGIVLQDLPFQVELKKFVVEYYDTGMPKLFASDIVVHDADGTKTEAKVKVNEPFIHKGIAIYQSSFEDGGSKLTLMARPMGRPGAPFEVKGEVGGVTTLTNAASQTDKLQLEFTGLRTINVENLAAENAGSTSGADVRKVDLVGSLGEHLGSGARVKADKKLHNVGPSVTYKLRDASGQAREYSNYMIPVELDGQKVFLAGVRDSPDQAFRYLRIPADERSTLDDWMQMKAALADPASRMEAARRYVRQSAPADKPELAQQLEASVLRALTLFAGAEAVRKDAPSAGLVALQDFIETNVPEADRSRTSEVLIRILNGGLFELLNLVRERAGRAALPPGEDAQRFMGQAVLSLSDSFAYPAPLLLSLTGFDQVQASVFQVTRAPGQKLVYLGCGFLILGVFAMLYIRERRLWIWIEGPADAPSTTVTLALSATRQTMDTDKDFDALKTRMLQTP